jgi:uncharacterized protein YqeY
MDKNQELLKTAGKMLKSEHDARLTLEKKARAEKIAFRKVELGIIEPFADYESFQKEANALVTEDLNLVEKAIEYGVHGSHQTGDLEKKANVSLRPADIMNHFVLTGELINE